MLNILTHTSRELNFTGEPFNISDMNGHRTISVHLHGFVGRIIIECSLADVPAEHDWFPIGFERIEYPDNFTNHLRTEEISGDNNIAVLTEIYLTELTRDDWYMWNSHEMSHIDIRKTSWKMFNGHEFSQMKSIDPGTEVNNKMEFISTRIGNGDNNFCIGRSKHNEVLAWMDGSDKWSSMISVHKINFAKSRKVTDYHIEYSSSDRNNKYSSGMDGADSYEFYGSFRWIRARIDRSYIAPEPILSKVGSVNRIVLL